MATFKVDMVHFHFNRTSERLDVWCFNDLEAYEPRAVNRVAKYDFGRKPDNDDGTPADCKEKILVGLYREPYRDGWKYTLHGKIHPLLLELVLDYLEYGLKYDAAGEAIPTTYLRHNRRALGIHYLFLRYYECYKEVQEENKRRPEYPRDYKREFIDYFREPYFPTPQSYDGYNHGRSR